MIRHCLFHRFTLTVIIGLLCSGIMITLLTAGILTGIESKSLDFRFLCRGVIPPNNKIAIIGTDEEALDKIKDPFIFWSPYFAEVIRAVARGGARVVGLDFLQTVALKKKLMEKTSTVSWLTHSWRQKT